MHTVRHLLLQLLVQRALLLERVVAAREGRMRRLQRVELLSDVGGLRARGALGGLRLCRRGRCEAQPLTHIVLTHRARVERRAHLIRLRLCVLKGRPVAYQLLLTFGPRGRRVSGPRLGVTRALRHLAATQNERDMWLLRKGLTANLLEKRGRPLGAATMVHGRTRATRVGERQGRDEQYPGAA